MLIQPSVLRYVAGLLTQNGDSTSEKEIALSIQYLQSILRERQLVLHTQADLIALGRNQLQHLQLALHGLAESMPTVLTAGTITTILAQLEQKLPLAIKRAAARQMIGTHLPLLAVIDPNILDLPLQAQLMRHAVGQTNDCDFCHSMFLSPSNCQSATLIPTGCYWLIGVENGTDTCTEAPGKMRYLEHSSGRSLLLIAEVIALATQTDVLQHHNLSVAGSWFDGSNSVPLLLNEPTGLNFCTHDPCNSTDNIGIASCLYRI